MCVFMLLWSPLPTFLSLVIHVNVFVFILPFTYSPFPPIPQSFDPVLNLILLAESVVKLKAVCMICFKDAAFTKRLGSEKQVCTSIIQ